jgi:uncharacterized phage-associated protein
MASVYDVAAYLRAKKSAPRLKLLKLAYYAQAWSLVWDGRQLFEDEIEAWPQGPVVRSLWVKDTYGTGPEGNPDALTDAERATIDAVVNFYGRLPPDALSELTHLEPPWRDARGALRPDEKSTAPVTVESMRRYFGSFRVEDKRLPVELERGIRLLLSLPPEEADALFEDSGEDADAFMASLESSS